MDDWRRYAGPAAFLLAVTIAVLLVRNGLEHGGKAATPPSVTTVASTPVTTAVTTTKAKKKPKRRYWTVSAGDTFAVISSKSGVPVATIEQLNPTVKSTSLFIGEKLRIE
ncbi:MAG TPA: LysM domain-containing protein [Gaiellaceae bacterium]|nr:LysM domain-containing protein [Gaiellaceae bacterium]